MAESRPLLPQSSVLALGGNLFQVYGQETHQTFTSVWF